MTRKTENNRIASRIPDRFIEKYFPTPDKWEQCVVQRGLGPRTPGEAEAIKRMVIHLRNQERYNHLEEFVGLAPKAANVDALLEKIVGLETWFWSDKTIRDVLAWDLNPPNTGGKIGLPSDIGQGFHLFQFTGEYQPLPSAMLITDGEVYPMTVAGIGEVGGTAILSGQASIHKYPEAFMLATNMLCFLKQRLVENNRVKGLPRPDRKRIGINSPDSKVEVNTVRWRKGVYNDRRDDRVVGADFHFPVKGHFRWQWYPSRGENGEYGRIWIDGYFKGDVNKPLKVSKPVPKVNKVTA